MLPEAIEKIIDCYVDDLVLIDEYCNVGHTNRMNQMNKCNTLAEYEVDRLYHPLVEDEIFRLMVFLECFEHRKYDFQRCVFYLSDLTMRGPHLVKSSDPEFRKFHKL